MKSKIQLLFLSFPVPCWRGWQEEDDDDDARSHYLRLQWEALGQNKTHLNQLKATKVWPLSADLYVPITNDAWVSALPEPFSSCVCSGFGNNCGSNFSITRIPMWHSRNLEFVQEISHGIFKLRNDLIDPKGSLVFFLRTRALFQSQYCTDWKQVLDMHFSRKDFFDSHTKKKRNFVWKKRLS